MSLFGSNSRYLRDVLIFCCYLKKTAAHWMLSRFRSKEIGFRTSWSRDMLNGVSLLINSCFKDRIRRFFYIALWLATKNGSTMMIRSAENHRKCPDMPPRRWPQRIFTVPRLCSTFHGTSSMWCIMSCCNRVKLSRGIGIECNWCVWAEHWRRNGHMSQDWSRYTWKLSRHCSFRLPFDSIDGTRPGSSVSALIKIIKNGSIRRLPQKTHRLFKMVSHNCHKGRKK